MDGICGLYFIFKWSNTQQTKITAGNHFLLQVM
jgi:hypothetical protein